MKKINYNLFLGSLGFLGFLGFEASENYPYLTKLANLSLLSLASLLTLLPFKTPMSMDGIELKKKGSLCFLGFLGSSQPGLAGLACLAIFSGRTIRPSKKTHDVSTPP